MFYGLWLLGTLIGGIAIGLRVRRLRDHPQGVAPLPLAGGAPQDRAEAVRRILKHLQRKTIAELGEGSAAVIEGTVRAVAGVPPLSAPYSRHPCIGYHLDVREALRSDLRFVQIHEDATCGDFELEDATGIIRIIGAGLELAITDGPFQYCDVVPPQLAHRVPHRYRQMQYPVTVEEGLLVPGAKILVCGVVTSELSATDYRDGRPIYTIRATPSFPLVASTDRDLFLPGDRPIAPEELHKRRA